MSVADVELGVAAAAAAVFASALALLVAAFLGAGKLRAALRLGAIVGATAALAFVRMAATRYSFFHANFHSAAILDGVYEAPWRSVRHYGVFHSLVYGGAMRAFGPDLRVVCRLNELIAAVTLALMGFVAARWRGSRLAGAAVVAIGALQPVFLRLAGSEEGHNLAVMLMWVAIAAIEVQRARPSRAAFALLGSALLLMIDTKQIGIVAFPPIVLLAHRRVPFASRRSLRWLAAGLSLALLFPLQTLVSEGGGMLRAGFRVSPLWLLLSVKSHPLLDPRGAAYLMTPLVVIGAAWAIKRMEGGLAAMVMLLALLGSSFLITEGVAASLTFRLPALLVATVFAGLGLEVLLRLWRARAVVTGAALAVVAVSPLALPGWSLVEQVSPSTDEYDALRELAPTWPAGAAIAQYPWREPAYRFPVHLLRDGEPPKRPSEDAPVLFWRGIGCGAFSLGERSQRFLRSARPADLAFPKGPAMLPVMPNDIDRGAVRPECAELLVGATPLGPARTIATPNDLDLPFAAFSSPQLEVQMFVLAPEVARAVSRRGELASPLARNR